MTCAIEHWLVLSSIVLEDVKTAHLSYVGVAIATPLLGSLTRINILYRE